MAAASTPWGCTPSPGNPYCSASPTNATSAASSTSSDSSSKHGAVTVALVVSSFILAALLLAGSVGLIAFRVYSRRREARQQADREAAAAAAAAAEVQEKQEWEPGLATIPTVVIHPDLEVHVAFQLDDNSQPVRKLVSSWPSCPQLGSVPARPAATPALESGHAACPENIEESTPRNTSGTSIPSWSGAGSESDHHGPGSGAGARRSGGALGSMEILVVRIDD
ncbi:hypothetical protein N2152v2_000072 [Parachlorella kessleri]